MHSLVSTQYYHTVMITCTSGANQDCLRYLMYEDMGNKPYAMALGSCIKDDGDVAERGQERGLDG
eukprot:7047325-Heterocapsa_arctica.AAC.1